MSLVTGELHGHHHAGGHLAVSVGASPTFARAACPRAARCVPPLALLLAGGVVSAVLTQVAFLAASAMRSR